MSATMTEIAREAKVSLPLVSRFFNNDATLRISDEKRSRIEQAKMKLGGVRIRRVPFDTQKKITYNFSVPVNRCFSFEWFQKNISATEEFRAFEQTLWSRNFRVSINFFDPDKCLDFLKDMAASHCDGFFLDGGVVDDSVAQWLMENRIPHVSIAPRDHQWGVNTVYEYAISGLRQSLGHLLNLGHRRIGYVGTQVRYPEFLLVMAEKEVPVKPEDYCLIQIGPDDNFSHYRDHAREAFDKWFRSDCGPTSVICANDYIALGVIDVLRDRGLKPGEDLSIIGYENIEQRGPLSTPTPILTTVDVPFDVIGQRCAERLLEQVVNGQWNIVHEQIPVKLIVRETTCACRVGK